VRYSKDRIIFCCVTGLLSSIGGGVAHWSYNTAPTAPEKKVLKRADHIWTLANKEKIGSAKGEDGFMYAAETFKKIGMEEKADLIVKAVSLPPSFERSVTVLEINDQPSAEEFYRDHGCVEKTLLPISIIITVITSLFFLLGILGCPPPP
jgi:hypothetical protein